MTPTLQQGIQHMEKLISAVKKLREGQPDAFLADDLAADEAILSSLRSLAEADGRLPPVPDFRRLRSGFIGKLDGGEEPVYSQYCMKSDYDALRTVATAALASKAEDEKDAGRYRAALQQIHDAHDGYCEHHVGVSQHSHDLVAIADEALSDAAIARGEG